MPPGCAIDLDRLDAIGDVLGRRCRLLGEVLDLVGHDTEALARVTGASYSSTTTPMMTALPFGA